MRSSKILQESNLRIFAGGGVGSVSIREKTNKHFEKNSGCATSKGAQKKTFVEEKFVKGKQLWDLVEPQILRFLD